MADAIRKHGSIQPYSVFALRCRVLENIINVEIFKKLNYQFYTVKFQRNISYLLFVFSGIRFPINSGEQNWFISHIGRGGVVNCNCFIVT